MPSISTRRLFGVFIAAGLTGVSGSARAYELQMADSGADVRWTQTDVELVVDASMAAVSPDAAALVERAFTTWNGVATAAAPHVTATAGDADDVGYVPGAENHSTVRYAAEGSVLAGISLATTIVTYDSDGVVVDADIIVNGGGDRLFAELPPEGERTIFGVLPPYDAENVLTHEAGHFLGLAHEASADATMFATSERGETSKRTLSADDEAGLAALYPPTEGADAVMGCAFAGGASAGSHRGPLAALLALGVGIARKLRGTKRAASACAASVAMALAVVPAAPAASSTPADLHAVVRHASTQREAGMIVTALDVELPSGAVRHVEVYGGTHDGYTQIVGAKRAPTVDAPLRVDANTGDLDVSELPLRAR